MKHKLTYILLVLIVFCSPANTTKVQAAENPKGVKLKLSINTKIVRLGEKPAKLRVELWNYGPDNFISAEALSPYTSAPAFLLIEAVNEQGERAKLWQLQVMGAPQEWWNRIPPGHYYGTEYDLNPTDIDALAKPGLYKLVATYVSNGGNTSAVPEHRLPSYAVWKGKLESNSVSIQVVQKSNGNK